MRKARADLSGPVLTIIVTLAVIAAGLIIMGYFWWFAPHASKQAAITVLGEPALQISPVNDTYSTIDVYVTLKNDGNDNVTIQKLVLSDDNRAKIELLPSSGGSVILAKGTKQQITFEVTKANTEFSFNNSPSYEGTILTDSGVIPVSVYVVK